MCLLPSPDTFPSPPSSSPTLPPTFVPKDALSLAAYSLASSHLHPTILNHSIRVFLYAKLIAASEANAYASGYLTAEKNLALLFTACILHDIGTTPSHNGTQRFEVCGGDAAYTLLTSPPHSPTYSEADAHSVWTAISLHTSPGIAERIHPLSKLVRAAVLSDFHRGVEINKDFEKEFPRLGIEKVLGDAVVEQAVSRPEKARMATWAGVMLRSYEENPGWQGVNKGF
ncbi:hypothetical protein BJ875DRAFT_544311 [Amylocarpus encephaloides]|uniref:HD/PDEase domain-containing protein n=1 Tax=Amylocarpus encephaloides TaxID=45428 RepID=A0A9P7YFG7_9HELO|nr:hypothetical protein BJ875DRAFT_544311 [Amylocarpus encephaloides]